MKTPLCLLVAILSLITSSSVYAADKTWTGATNNDWYEAGNWEPSGVPTTNDTINISNVSPNAPDATPAVTIAGTLNWSGGRISGALTVASNGVLNITGNGRTTALWGPLTNYGTVNWTGNPGDYIQVLNSGSAAGAIYNQAGALFDVQCDQDLYHRPAIFSNRGTFRKRNATGVTLVYMGLFDNRGIVDADSGTIRFGTEFDNAGIVTVQSGTVQFESGGTLGGSYQVTNGSAINLAAGSFVQGAAPTFTGPGQSQMTGGSLTLTNDVIPGLTLAGGDLYLTPTFQGGSITNLTLAGVTLRGTNTVRGVLNWMTGTINGWTAGEINGALTIASNGVLNVSGPSTKFLSASLTNWGVVNWLDGYFLVFGNNGGAIYNQGLFDVQCDQLMYYADATFANTGTFRKKTTAGTTTLHMRFDNASVVIVQSGDLRLEGGGTLRGNYDAASGSTISLAAGNFVQGGAPVFTGSGQSRMLGDSFNRPSLTLTTDAIPGLTLADGDLYLTPSFQGGSITNLTLAGVTLQGTNAVRGVLNWMAGRINGWTAGEIDGALTIASDGVLNVSGPSTKFLSASLTNWGVVNWLDGYFLVFGNNGGAIYNQGLFDVQCDQLMHYADATFANTGTFRKRATTGTTTLYVRFDNAGKVETWTGLIRFQGEYAGSSTATLGASLGGTDLGTGYGHIVFPSPLTLDGSFTVSTRNGFRPNPGDIFNVLSYPSATNDFACYSGLDLGGGLWLQPTLGKTSLTLTATTYPTNGLPSLFIARSPRGVRVLWTEGFPDWALESATNLVSPIWLPVAATNFHNQTVLPAMGSQQYFRLRNQAPPVDR